MNGVSQINLTVSEINAVTQQVAANAKESASAATELDSQARTLRDTVGQCSVVTRKLGGATVEWRSSTSRVRTQSPSVRNTSKLPGSQTDSDDV